MATTHRTLDGDWAECAAPDTCELLFHFPDMTPQQVAEMPLRLLMPLLEAVDPPGRPNYLGGKMWLERSQAHREYDLPAWVGHDGTLEWFKYGTKHRGHNRPQLVKPDGTREWWVMNQRHREDGPAVIHPDDRVEFWLQGNQLYSAAALANRLKDIREQAETKLYFQ